MTVPPGRPRAGPAPGALAASSCVEVNRLVTASGAITLGNQLVLVGSPLAGQRARIRLDGQLMHVITQDAVLWRTLPCPIPPGQRHRLQGVRLASPAPLPPSSSAVQRRPEAPSSVSGGPERYRDTSQGGLGLASPPPPPSLALRFHAVVGLSGALIMKGAPELGG